jgi:glutathione S-transferase
MNLEYELLFVDKKAKFQKSAEYLKLNPAGVIPTLIENGQPLTESPAICIHLCESHPEHGLIPLLGDPQRPFFFQWLAYLNNTLQADLMFSNYAHTHTNDERTIPNIVAAQSDRIVDALSIINDQLEGKQYLLGDQLTACDYFLFMLAGWSFHGTTSPLNFKHLAAYLKRMCGNSTIKAVCEIEGIDLTPFESYQA